MSRRGYAALMAVLGLGGFGCSGPSPRPEYEEAVGNLVRAAYRPPGSIGPDDPMAKALDPAPTPPELSGPQPVAIYIRRALAENRAVQAARFNVLAMKSRIPQVTALDDPMFQGSIWPFPEHAPQYVTGYAPYDQMITQEFPWFGTLALRGQAAEQDVRIALFELASRQLETIARVKRAYQELAYYDAADRIVRANRALAEDVVEVARVRYENGDASQQDVLRAEVSVAELDRDLVAIRRGGAQARAEMARLLHVSPEADLRALPATAPADIPAQVDRLYRVAAAVRPDLRARLAAVARDEREVELARKRYYPNVQVGVGYMTMSRPGSVDPRADGMDNVGLVVGFNLPIYRRKLDAAVCEARARTLADARQYDYDRDETYAEIKELHAEAIAGRETIELLREGILPRSEQALEVSTQDYPTGRVDFVTLNTARQEVLRLRLQIARIEADLNKTLASLERAVGVELGGAPPAPPTAAPPAEPPPPTAPEDGSSPFAPRSPEPPDGDRRGADPAEG